MINQIWFAQIKQSKVSRQIEEIIDEKCRFLNKTGTSKGSAIHLAQWMKGQLDTEPVGNICNFNPTKK